MILGWRDHTRLTLKSIAHAMRLEGSATSRLLPPFETRQSAGVTPRDAAAPQGEVDSI